MNAMQSIAGGTQASAALAVGTATGGAQPGSGESVSGFASLFLGLMNGSATMGGEQQKLTLVGLFAETTVASADGAMPTEGGESEAASMEALLEQMLAWIESLAPEAKELLAQQPGMEQWLAMANAELAMAGFESANGAETAETPVDGGEANGATQLIATLSRLLEALRTDASHPHLTKAAEQAKELLAKAIDNAQLQTALNESAARQAKASETAADRAANAAKAANSSAAKAEAKPLAEWLALTNGKVVESTTNAKSESGTAQERASHLTAMEAKAALVRIATAEAAPTTSDAPQRVPLSNASNFVNDWLMKQAAAGGNLRTETVIRLVPEQLGQVEVKLSMQNGQLAATIVTESAMAKEALETNLGSLRANLQQAGVTVERLVVTQQQPTGAPSEMFQDGRHRQQSGREQEREQRSDKRNGSDDWADVLAVNAELEAAAAIGNHAGTFQAQA